MDLLGERGLDFSAPGMCDIYTYIYIYIYIYMWQSRIEIQYYFIAYFERITEFDAL